MKQLPSRYRRLDGALADLPVEEPMLLTELDGFLTGVILCPDPVVPAEWMQNVWGIDDGGVAPFDDPIDVQWFADAVMARHDAIVRDLDRGKLQPIFDIDERNGDVLWELWIDGFAEAMALRPDAWTAPTDDPSVVEARARLSLLIDVARQESTLDSMEINALEVEAPRRLIDAVLRLYTARSREDIAAVPMPSLAKVGRNDPCPCGSGKKAKRCCP